MLRYIYYLSILLVSLLGFSMETMAKTQSGKNFTVVIDAGHGGHDTGAVGNGELEKHINLKVAKQLESLIKKKMKDTKVVMTRDDDTFLTLQQRADKANKAKGDLFISIHTNSVDASNKNRKSIAGSSVYTLGLHKDENNLQVAMRENSVIEFENNYEQKYSGFDPQKDESYIIFEMAQKKNLSQSIKLAENIQKELVGIGRQDRGVHQAGFWVLWATSMPAVLVELDFICNPESAKYIASDKGSKEMAEAIFNAVERYEAYLNGAMQANVATEKEVEVPAEELAVKEEVAVSTIRTGKSTQANRKKNKEEKKEKENKKENQKQVQSQPEPEILIAEEVIVPEEVAVASTRRQERQHVSNNQPTASVQKKTNSSRRKRRSNESKQISLNTDYETDFIAVGSGRKSTTIGQSSKEDTELLASNSKKENNKKEKKKSTKEKPKKEKKEKKSVKRERVSTHNAKVNKIVTVYKIQVLASEDLLNSNNSRFCGLTPISTYKEDNKYKYYYGESTDLGEIEVMLADVKQKIPDAFIVASKKSIQTN